MFHQIYFNFVIISHTLQSINIMFYHQVHQYVNNLSRKDQVMPVQFPDVSPTKAKPKGGFNMVAGDFLQVIHLFCSFFFVFISIGPI